MKSQKGSNSDRKEMVKLTQTLRWRLTLFVFGVIMISGTLTVTFCLLMLKLFGRTPVVVGVMVNPFVLMVVLLGICAIFGTLMAGFLGKYYLKPLKQLIHATKEVKKGNFKVQVESKDIELSEMDQLIFSFNEMVRELDGIELFRNDFINNFSHEFKTPIVSIRGFAKELQYSDLDPVQRQEYAKIIAEEADRLAKLSTNVLELSRLENQTIVTNQKDFYLDEQLRQCILLQEAEWERKEIEIQPELEEILYHSNEELLSHVWMNLIGNAIKFTPQGGAVRIKLYREGGQVIVSIADTGVGMSQEVMEHIFEKFYQGDASHHRAGYGIGLTMAGRAAALTGATINVKSAPGVGSTFTVILPE